MRTPRRQGRGAKGWHVLMRATQYAHQFFLVLSPGDQLAGGKYTIQGVLGTGSNATAYKVGTTDVRERRNSIFSFTEWDPRTVQAVTAAGQIVAIKALSLRAIRDWKQLDLFQREAQILGALDHPCIPK